MVGAPCSTTQAIVSASVEVEVGPAPSAALEGDEVTPSVVSDLMSRGHTRDEAIQIYKDRTKMPTTYREHSVDETTLSKKPIGPVKNGEEEVDVKNGEDEDEVEETDSSDDEYPPKQIPKPSVVENLRPVSPQQQMAKSPDESEEGSKGRGRGKGKGKKRGKGGGAGRRKKARKDEEDADEEEQEEEDEQEVSLSQSTRYYGEQKVQTTQERGGEVVRSTTGKAHEKVNSWMMMLGAPTSKPTLCGPMFPGFRA